MTEALMVQPPPTQLVALTPAEMKTAQVQLLGWCQQKLVHLGRDLRDQRENLRQAKTMKWRHSGWQTVVRKTKARMIYLSKIKAAVAAGYLIVPNFDVEVIAVRVSRYATPKSERDVRNATPELLPPGQGRYVDDQLTGYRQERKYKDYQGRDRVANDFWPTGYDNEIDFPVGLVKPVVMQAAEHAMSLRIFDRLGIVRQSRRSDPIVVGQIIDPKTAGAAARRFSPTCVTFFVAWWLDLESL